MWNPGDVVDYIDFCCAEGSGSLTGKALYLLIGGGLFNLEAPFSGLKNGFKASEDQKLARFVREIVSGESAWDRILNLYYSPFRLDNYPGKVS